MSKREVQFAPKLRPMEEPKVLPPKFDLGPSHILQSTQTNVLSGVSNTPTTSLLDILIKTASNNYNGPAV